MFFIRAIKAKLDLLALLAPQVHLAPEAPLGTRERMGHVAPLESQ